MKNKLLKIILLAGAVILFYGNTFTSIFHFDDRLFVVENKNIRNLMDINAIWHSAPQNSRFVANFTFAVNYALGQLNVVGYHIVNILIHMINGFLVWWLITLLFNTPGLNKHKLFKYKDGIGWVAGMLFIAHPLQTQAVTYICQRYASLATLFYLLTMCWYLKARLSGQKKFFVLCVVSALLGMFTKEMTMTLPLMVIMTEWMMFEHKKWEWKNTVLYGLVLFGFFMIIPALMKFNFFWAIFEPKPSSSHNWDMILLEPFVMTQLKVWAILLGKVFVPIHQNVDYDFPLVHNFWQIEVWGSAVILSALLIFAVLYRRKNPLVSYGIMWFFVAMSIEMVPRIYVIFEHKMYLPFAGLCMAFTGLWQDKVEDEKIRMIIMTAVIVILGMLTFQRNAVWKDDISLWSDSVKNSPRKPTPNYNLGCAYQQKGMANEALYYFNQTFQSYRYHYKNLVNRALILEDRGDFNGALNDLNRAIFLRSDLAEAYNNRGGLMGKMNNYDQALANLDRALNLMPNFPEAYYNRAMVFQKTNRLPEAVVELTKAININPKYVGAYLNRGSVYLMLQKTDEAYRDLSRAIELYPQYAEAYLNRGAVEVQMGMAEQAVRDFTKALEYKPDWGMAYYDRFFIYRSMNQLDKARQDARYIIDANLELSDSSKQEIKKFLNYAK
ncbi:MAG: tetratricopeptide repeat protein [Candidatus Omnitrophica bacterium]|nr:tetratricopeptide repeat protein [Candidatus Omnitrophota bacterium]